MSVKKAPAPSLDLDLSAKRTTNLAVLQKLNPNVLEIIGDATHVALYSFEAAAAKWERLGIEGACFVTRCAQSPFYNLFVLNKMGDEDFVLDIKTIINIKLQPPYVMLRYSGPGATCIVGLWFHDDAERAAMKDLVSRAMQSSAASVGGNGASSGGGGGGGGGGIQALKALLGAGQATPPPPAPAADKPTGANLLAMLKAPESVRRTLSAPIGSLGGEVSSSSSSKSGGGGGGGGKAKGGGNNGQGQSKDDSAPEGKPLLPGHGRELQPYFCDDGSVREGGELWGFVAGAGAVQGELLTDREISLRRAVSQGDISGGGGGGNGSASLSASASGSGGGNGETVLLASKLKSLLKAPPTPTPAPAPAPTPSPVLVGRQLSISALLPGLSKALAAVAAATAPIPIPTVAPAPAAAAITMPAATSPAPGGGKLLSPSDLTGLKKSYTAAK